MNYLNLQEAAVKLSKENEIFNFKNESYKVKKSGKPQSRNGGEPKTDLFILAEKVLDNSLCEFKISFKKANADFLENKITKPRAELLFGEDWSNILQSSVEKIVEKINTEKELIYFNKKGNVKERSITAGWRIDLMNKKSGKLSEKISLTEQQKINIYTGNNLPEEKRNATVNGKIINNSGVANYISIIDEIKTLQEIFDSLIDIKSYIQNNNDDIYFACKASNMWFEHKKEKEGNRSLGIYLNWFLDNENKINYKVVSNQPLEKTTDDVRKNFNKILEQIENKSFKEIKQFIHKDVKVY